MTLVIVDISDAEFSKAIQDALDDGISTGDMAMGIGVSRPTIERWLNGQRMPRQANKKAFVVELDRLRDEHRRKKKGVND